MKTNHLKALVAALVLTSYAGFASAGGTTTVQVKATVNAVCKFNATPPAAIDLGTIDPSAVAADVTGTTDVGYQCTKGTTPSVTVTNGGTTLSDGGTNSITYSVALGTPDAGTGFSAAGTAKVVATAKILKAAAQDAAAAAYTDTVTLTINN